MCSSLRSELHLQDTDLQQYAFTLVAQQIRGHHRSGIVGQTRN